MAPDVSAIIVSHNTLGLTMATVKHLVASAQRSDLALETIVVDNASTDGTPTVIEKRFPELELIALRENLGFASAINLAMTRARAPFLLLLNSDSVLLDDALGELCRFTRAHPKAGLVGCSLIYSDGEHQDSAFMFPTLPMTLIDLLPVPNRLRNTGVNGRYRIGGEPIRVDHPLGACMFVRRAAIDEAGGLDESYYMYSEELDWCWRIKQAGWEVWSLPAARAIHYAGSSTRQLADQMYYELFKSRRRFASKWYPREKYGAIDAGIRIGMCWKIASTLLNRIRGKLGAEEAEQAVSTYLRIALSNER